MIGVVHVNQRAQHGATTCLGMGLDGSERQQRTRGVAEMLVVALDLQDVGVPGDRPERSIQVRLHSDDRPLAPQHPAGGVEPLLIGIGSRVHEDPREIGQVGQAHWAPPLSVNIVS